MKPSTAKRRLRQKLQDGTLWITIEGMEERGVVVDLRHHLSDFSSCVLNEVATLLELERVEHPRLRSHPGLCILTTPDPIQWLVTSLGASLGLKPPYARSFFYFRVYTELEKIDGIRKEITSSYASAPGARRARVETPRPAPWGIEPEPQLVHPDGLADGPSGAGLEHASDPGFDRRSARRRLGFALSAGVLHLEIMRHDEHGLLIHPLHYMNLGPARPRWEAGQALAIAALLDLELLVLADRSVRLRRCVLVTEDEPIVWLVSALRESLGRRSQLKFRVFDLRESAERDVTAQYAALPGALFASEEPAKQKTTDFREKPFSAVFVPDEDDPDRWRIRGSGVQGSPEDADTTAAVIAALEASGNSVHQGSGGNPMGTKEWKYECCALDGMFEAETGDYLYSKKGAWVSGRRLVLALALKLGLRVRQSWRRKFELESVSDEDLLREFENKPVGRKSRRSRGSEDSS